MLSASGFSRIEEELLMISNAIRMPLPLFLQGKATTLNPFDTFSVCPAPVNLVTP